MYGLEMRGRRRYTVVDEESSAIAAMCHELKRNVPIANMMALMLSQTKADIERTQNEQRQQAGFLKFRDSLEDAWADGVDQWYDTGYKGIGLNNRDTIEFMYASLLSELEERAKAEFAEETPAWYGEHCQTWHTYAAIKNYLLVQDDALVFNDRSVEKRDKERQKRLKKALVNAEEGLLEAYHNHGFIALRMGRTLSGEPK